MIETKTTETAEFRREIAKDLAPTGPVRTRTVCA
jgi:hypothetical protein